MFIVLLNFSESLARVAKVSDRTKCLFLNDDPWMVRPTLIDMNLVEPKYYPFMIKINVLEIVMSYLKRYTSSKRNKRHKC